MTTWASAHQRAAALAAQLHADLDVPLDRPVDVFGAVERLGLVLAFAPLGKVSGLYIPYGRSRGILLHAGHPRTRQRYTAAHELGHHMFGHEMEVDTDLELALQRSATEKWPGHEKEAEAFAAWFLMPRRLLRVGLHQLQIDELASPLQVYQLSLWVGASYAATARQLGTTRLLHSGKAEQWSRIPPRELKKGILGQLTPDDLRNDVWWLDGTHNRNPIDVRPGDRLVLTLEEIPSSGYEWSLSELPAAVRLVEDSFESEWQPSIVQEPATPDDFAGGVFRRWLVFEVDPAAEPTIQRLALKKDRPWETSPIDDFELLVAINSPLSGVQLPEEEFAIVS